MVYRKRPFQKFLRLLMFLPAILSAVTVFTSCSRDSLQVQRWNKLDNTMAYQKPDQSSSNEVIPATAGKEIASATASADCAASSKGEKIPAKTAAKKLSDTHRIMEKAADKMLAQAGKQLPVVASVSQKVQGHSSLDKDLKTAILFILIGIIIAVLGKVVDVLEPLFALVGAIFVVIGLIFLLLWLLDQ